MNDAKSNDYGYRLMFFFAVVFILLKVTGILVCHWLVVFSPLFVVGAMLLDWITIIVTFGKRVDD